MDLKYKIWDCFSQNRWVFISFIACVLLGIACGVGLNVGGNSSFLFVSVEKHFSISVKISIGGVFLRRLFTGIFFFGITIVAGLHVFAQPLSFIGVFLQGYYMGGLCVLLCVSYGLAGVIVLITVLLPCQLAWCFISFVCGGYSLICCNQNKRCRCFDARRILFFYLQILIVYFAIIILECLLIALIANNFLF